MTSSARAFRIVVRSLAVIAAAFLLAEGGTRILLRIRGRPYDAERSRAWIEGVCEDVAIRGESPRPATDPVADSGLVLEPYVAWEDVATQARMSDEADEYGRTGAREAGSRETYDVLVLGGTAAKELVANDSARLVESLRRDARFADREIRIHGFGQAGFKQPQPMILLAYLLSLGHAPALVVEIDGRDETRVGWSNAKAGTHPLHPSIEAWSRASNGMRPDWELVDRVHALRGSRDRARAFGERLLALGVPHSAFLEHFAVRRLVDLRAEAVADERRFDEYASSRPREAELDGPRFPTDDASIARTIVQGWEEASLFMHACCARRGIDFLHVLEPMIETPADLAKDGPAIAGLRDGLREAAARLRTRGVLVLDLSGSRDDPADAIARALATNGAR